MKSNWTKVKLIDVCVQITDGAHNTVYDTPGGDCFLLSCKNIKNGAVRIGEKERRIDKKTLENLRSRTKMSIGDVLISSVGTIGETAIVKEDNPPYEFQRSVAIFKPNQRCITPKFLYYSLRHKKKKLQHLAEGAVQQCLFINPLKEFEISIPTLEEQEKIVNVLSSLDNKIELNEKINQNLEAQAQAIFKSWFVDFEPFKNGKFIDSELGKIPEGWRVERLGQVLNIRYGKNLPQTKLKISGYPVYGANGQIGFYSEYMFKSPQVLVSCRGAASGKVNISTKNSFITNNSLILDYTTSKTLSFAYLKYYALRADFSPFVTGSAQPQITIETISSAKILVPNKQIMSKFNLTISPIVNAIFKNNEETCYLAQLRDTLLPKLMSGEIDVSDVAV